MAIESLLKPVRKAVFAATLGLGSLFGSSETNAGEISPVDQIIIGHVVKDMHPHTPLTQGLGTATMHMGIARLNEGHYGSPHWNKPLGSHRTFVCNYGSDFNHNGRIELGELVGLNKTNFTTDERITVGMKISSGALHQEVDVKVFSPRGLQVYSNGGKFMWDDAVRKYELNVADLRSRFGTGTYTAAFYYNGSLWDIRTFNLNPGIGIRTGIVYNSFRDVNGNGIDDISEFSGAEKTVFRKGEEMGFALFFHEAGVGGKSASVSLMSPKDELVSSFDVVIPQDYYSCKWNFRNSPVIDACGNGVYRFDFYLDGNKFDSRNVIMSE